MLKTACTLFSLLACVSGAIVLTQKPAILTVNKGDSATMDCNLGTGSDRYTFWITSWYKQQELLTPHTANMLETACTLFSLLACVSGAIVLTQEPAILTVNKGDTASMDCNLGTGSERNSFWYTRWYKQIPGGLPHFVLYRHKNDSSTRYGTGFSSSRISCNQQSRSEYRFMIKNVEAGDSAVYYCHIWDNSAKEDISQ
ncbi:hypothetical protein GJAV_G00035480 [Gymnothorax javanicus]|nr:hypothetical protein GJAV_G00035480 [Gymnothorax javanicus]